MNKNLVRQLKLHLIAIVIFLGVSVIYNLPALKGMGLNQTDVVGWKGMAQQSFEFKEKHGNFPLWTNSMFSGMPAYQIMFETPNKVSIGYLHNYLFTLGLPKPVGYFFLACIMAYFFFLVLGANTWISIIGALTYSFATFSAILAAVGHDNEFVCMGYAPGVLGGLLLIYQGRYIMGTVLTSLFTSMIIWQNHIQIVYYTLIMALFLSAAYFITAYRNKQIKHAVICCGLALFSCALAIGVNTINIWPIQELTEETMRSGRSELTSENKANKTKGGLDKDYAFRYSYGLAETFTFMVPRIYGGSSPAVVNNEYRNEWGENTNMANELTKLTGMQEEQANDFVKQFPAYWGPQTEGTSGPVYFGAIICFLFILGMVYVKSWHKWWILAATVFAIILAWGKNLEGVNYFLFEHMPLYKKFRAPTMALVIPQLTFSALSVLALQQFLFDGKNKQELWKKLKTALLVTGGVFVILVLMYFSFDYSSPTDKNLKEGLASNMIQQMAQGKQPTPEIQQQAMSFSGSIVSALHADRKSLFGGDLLRSLLFVALAAGLIVLYTKGKIKAYYALAGVALLIFIDLLGVDRRYLDYKNFVEPADNESAFVPTQADLKIKADTTKYFRVYDESGGNPWSDSRASYFFNTIGGYSPAKLALYQDIIERQLSRGNQNVFNMLNTRWIIVNNPANRQPEAEFNPGAYGNCWFVKGFKIARNADDEMNILSTLNTHDSAVVDARFERTAGSQPAHDTTGTIKLIENLNDKISYQSIAATNQFAVFSEVYYPHGWNAYIDGNLQPYVRVNYVLRGMPVPAGKHTIEFRFEPRSVLLGDKITMWMSILFYILLIAGIVYEIRIYNKSRVV